MSLDFGLGFLTVPSDADGRAKDDGGRDTLLREEAVRGGDVAVEFEPAGVGGVGKEPSKEVSDATVNFGPVGVFPAEEGKSPSSTPPPPMRDPRSSPSSWRSGGRIVDDVPEVCI